MLLDYLPFGVIVSILLFNFYLMFHFDRKQDARSADLSQKIDTAVADLRAEMREEREVRRNEMQEERETRRAEMQEEREVRRAEMKALLDRDDLNASDIRTEMRGSNDRIEGRLNTLSDEQREHGKQITRLESSPDVERQPVGDD